MSDSIVDQEVVEGNKLNNNSPPASVSSEEGNFKMADIDDIILSGKTLADAIRTDMENQALLEEERNRTTDFRPSMLPSEVPPAPAWPAMPLFGGSEDYRFQQQAPIDLGRGA